MQEFLKVSGCAAAHHFLVRGETYGHPAVCVCAHLILHICPDATITQKVVTRLRITPWLPVSVHKEMNANTHTLTLKALEISVEKVRLWICKGQTCAVFKWISSKTRRCWSTFSSSFWSQATASLWLCCVYPSLTLCSLWSLHSRWLWSWQRDPLVELWGRDNLQNKQNKHSAPHKNKCCFPDNQMAN